MQSSSLPKLQSLWKFWGEIMGEHHESYGSYGSFGVKLWASTIKFLGWNYGWVAWKFCGKVMSARHKNFDIELW